MPNGTPEEQREYGKLIHRVTVLESNLRDYRMEWQNCNRCDSAKEYIMGEITEIHTWQSHHVNQHDKFMDKIEKMIEKKEQDQQETRKFQRNVIITLITGLTGSGGLITLLLAWLLDKI